MNKRKTGADKEKIAADYLTAKGIRILERNYRVRQGEIDIVGADGRMLVFFEVKYRKDNRMGDAIAAVDVRKQRKICHAADFYRFSHRIEADRSIRYDVVGIQGDEIIWIKNAFPHHTSCF